MAEKPGREPLFTFGVEAPSRKFFQGEEMACCMCSRKQMSEAGVESNWRCIEVNGTACYVCPVHFPSDGSPSWKFKKAYDRILAHILGGRN
jgi:hypothetical protein